MRRVLRPAVRAATLGVAVLLVGVALPLRSVGAQPVVGNAPDKSPFRDLEWRQQLIPLLGTLSTSDDVAGVGPRASGYVGVRYDVHVGGPAALTSRLAFAPGERTVKDPTRPEPARTVGTTSANLLMADVGLQVSLTGRKSWHRLVPVVGIGAGFVSDFESKPDTGNYQFGTKFAFNWGLGLRYHSGRRVEWRVDATNYLWQLRYPDSYRTSGTNLTPLLPAASPQNQFNGNWAFTLGAAYGFFR